MVEQQVWQGGMGRNWARLHEATDRQLAEVGEAVVGLLGAQSGECILDLGCGAASTSIAIAESVGNEGCVTGVDVSTELVALARRRAKLFPNVTILEADAADHKFEPATHDALFSRHGCMFFTDATAAFANVRRALKPGARVAMSAFSALAENPWATVPLRAAETILGSASPNPQAPPGPFSWAEPLVFETALKGAGFQSIDWEKRTVSFKLWAGLHADDASRQRLEGLHKCHSLDLPSQDNRSGAVEPKQMKYVLADVDADHRNAGR